MGLYQRITAQDNTKIAVHRLGAGLRQMAAGQLTRQQIIDAFVLTGDDVTQLDALIATYNGIATNNTTNTFNKARFLDAMEDVFLLCETGDYTEQKARTALGF